MIKVRDGAHVTNKAAHIAVGVDMDGIKHVLGIWVQDSEGARFWAQVCAELANRGIKDVLIVCCDGLTGLPEAIEATWPRATVQTCVVHLIRAATRFVSYSDRKAVAAALRPIYQAPSEEAAWEALETFEASELGQRRYPAAVRTFTDSWERLTPFLAFPPMVRRVISPPLRGRYPLHQRDRVAELPAAQGHQEPGSLPLRRGSGQAAVAGYLRHRGQESPTTAKGAAERTGRQERDHRQTDRGRYNHQLEASPPTAVPGLSRPNQPPPVTHTTYTSNLTLMMVQEPAWR